MPGSTASSQASIRSADGRPFAELVDAHKSYGDVQALKGVSLAVNAGELVAMLGPNGAGKTTAISLMTGLRKPTSGSARLFGLAPTDIRARSRMGVMLQESGVPLSLRVREIVDLFRTYYPRPLPTERVLEIASISDLGGKLISQLSGGQKQRVYFALAVCGDPDMLFLDEPTVGLDVASRRAFWEQVRALVGGGKGIVLTTHYLEEADALATRVVVVDHGVKVAEGSPAAIKDRVPGKKVSFTTAGPLQDADFRDLAIQNLSIRDSTVELLTNEPEAVLKALFERGTQIRDLEVVGAGLEEAVLSLTEGRG
ncbi:MAG: ABC transporter ATP-binding protein [Chloroflexi bacterium]|nr:MAG: ABC transporter ATP-binding protein [Chloroflexota bacterium]TME15142.1 MAG: ABC transporter ATP-binding protein [Chloroflexota bacterium]